MFVEIVHEQPFSTTGGSNREIELMTGVEPMNRTNSMILRAARSMKLVAVLALIGCYAPSLHAQSACEDVSGIWAVGLDLPGSGHNTVTLTLEQTECEVTGLVEGRNKTPIEDGTVEGATATFTAVARNQGDGQTIGVVWEVTVVEDEVTGTLRSPMMGTIEFEGTRVEG